jgi:hypothetical protein
LWVLAFLYVIAFKLTALLVEHPQVKVTLRANSTELNDIVLIFQSRVHHYLVRCVGLHECAPDNKSLVDIPNDKSVFFSYSERDQILSPISEN